MTTSRFVLGGRVAAVLLGVYALACGPSEPRVGTQTNWLRSCESSADCGEFKCLCGVCTRRCEDGDELACADLPEASCVPDDDAGATALCGGNRPLPPGLCLPECPVEGCGEGLSCVAGVCTPNLEPGVQVLVDETRRFQTFAGVGAAVAYWTAEVTQHPRKQEMFDAMFSDTGFSVLRLRNDYEESPDDLAEIAEVHDAASERLGRAPTIILNSASPPSALKVNGSTYCEANPDTCTLTTLPDGSFDYQGLADHWRASLEAYAQVGIEPDYISIQNNPNYVPVAGEPIEACRFLPTEGSEVVIVDGAETTVDYPGYAQALDAVHAEIDDLPFVPQLVAPETTSFTQVADYAVELDFEKVTAIAHHMYEVDPADLDLSELSALSEFAAEQGRPLFQSEMQADALTTALLMHAAFAVEGVELFVHNGFVAPANSLGSGDDVLIRLTEDDFVLEEPYHVMRHYAAHIDPGWVRVAADSDSENLLTSAWISPDEEMLTVVLTNPSSAEQVAALGLGAQQPARSRVTRTSLSGVERSQSLGELPMD
ncbi:MAG TPA: hypothetical protein VI197_17565, partial [Polyangiaceae bacterium]